MKFKISYVDMPVKKDDRFILNLQLECPDELGHLSCELLDSYIYQLFTSVGEIDIKTATDNNLKFDNNIKENVCHPSHYGGKDNPYETVRVIEAWYGLIGLKYFCLGNTLKYSSRAGKKEGNSEEQDLAKAEWYTNYYNKRVKEVSENKN